ncbi:hypothetical protein N8639_02205 [bacterium]|jgi:hypothetical protein|nr:hypothetical protein [bacterium]MDB4413376.1 hypothetical protein [Pirellulaceae bacterium]
MHERQETIEKYFAGIAENTFHTQLGVVNPPLVNYVTNLLIRFVRLDNFYRVRSISGKPIMDVDELVGEATMRLGDAKREILQYIGDFTLFWLGVFPESFQKNGERTAKYNNFCEHGSRSYEIASQIETTDDEAPDSGVLETLSESFELCAYGIQEVRREWERNDDSSSGPIIL